MKKKLAKKVRELSGGGETPEEQELFKKLGLILKFRKEASAALKVMGKDQVMLGSYDSIDKFMEALSDGSLEVGTYRVPKFLVAKTFWGWKPFLKGIITNQKTFGDTLQKCTAIRRRMRAIRARMNEDHTPHLKTLALHHRITDVEKSIEIDLYFGNLNRLQYVRAQTAWLGTYTRTTVKSRDLINASRWSPVRVKVKIYSENGRAHVAREVDVPGAPSYGYEALDKYMVFRPKKGETQ